MFYLIGVDGVFLCVCFFIYFILLLYLGVLMYEFIIFFKNMIFELKMYVGQGCLLVFDEGMIVLLQMNFGGLCKVYVGLRCFENWIDENFLFDKGKWEWLVNFF